MINSENDTIEVLQGILLGYLSGNGSNFNNLVQNNCRHFFWAQMFANEVLRKRRIDCSGKEMISLGGRQNKLLLQKSSKSDANEIPIDYADAFLIAQYLIGKRRFEQIYEEYLEITAHMLREPRIDFKMQAMKSLMMIAEVDASILKQSNMQENVKQAILDQAISVRQKTVEVIGICVLNRPRLIDHYYDFLLMGLRDNGVSVRKRCIQIMRDICIGLPNLGKRPEMCIEMMKRANEDDSVRELIVDAFMQMWFTPCADNDKVSRFSSTFHIWCRILNFRRRLLAVKLLKYKMSFSCPPTTLCDG